MSHNDVDVLYGMALGSLAVWGGSLIMLAVYVIRRKRR